MPLYISPILLPTNTKQQWVWLVSNQLHHGLQGIYVEHIIIHELLQRVYCMPPSFINTEKLEEDILKAVEIMLAEEQSG